MADIFESEFSEDDFRPKIKKNISRNQLIFDVKEKRKQGLEVFAKEYGGRIDNYLLRGLRERYGPENLKRFFEQIGFYSFQGYTGAKSILEAMADCDKRFGNGNHRRN